MISLPLPFFPHDTLTVFAASAHAQRCGESYALFYESQLHPAILLLLLPLHESPEVRCGSVRRTSGCGNRERGEGGGWGGCCGVSVLGVGVGVGVGGMLRVERGRGEMGVRRGAIRGRDGLSGCSIFQGVGGLPGCFFLFFGEGRGCGSIEERAGRKEGEWVLDVGLGDLGVRSLMFDGKGPRLKRMTDGDGKA